MQSSTYDFLDALDSFARNAEREPVVSALTDAPKVAPTTTPTDPPPFTAGIPESPSDAPVTSATSTRLTSAANTEDAVPTIIVCVERERLLRGEPVSLARYGFAASLVPPLGTVSGYKRRLPDVQRTRVILIAV